MTLPEDIIKRIRAQYGCIKDVGYYNKDIIKNNKDITEIEDVSSSSFGLEALASSRPQEDTVSDPPPGGSQQKEIETSITGQIQSPTSPPRLISEDNLTNVLVQYYRNPEHFGSQQKKIKIQLRLQNDQGLLETAEFIAVVTNDLGNFKKYHPEESRDWIQKQVDQVRKEFKDLYGNKPYMGKFHLNRGWLHNQERINQIEPWSAAVLAYNPMDKKYRCFVTIYDYMNIFVLDRQGLTANQIRANIHSQARWTNPKFHKFDRPVTWAQSKR